MARSERNDAEHPMWGVPEFGHLLARLERETRKEPPYNTQGGGDFQSVTITSGLPDLAGATSNSGAWRRMHMHSAHCNCWSLQPSSALGIDRNPDIIHQDIAL